MQRNGCVTSNTSFQHPFHTCPNQGLILSGLPQLPTQLCHQDLVHAYISPISFSTTSHLACSSTPLPSPHSLPTLSPQCFDTPALKFCGNWNQVLMPGGFHLKFTLPLGLHRSFCLLLNYFHWLLHSHPCFLSYLFSHSPSLSPPQLPFLKFPFLKCTSPLKAFIINLSRNYLRDSSAVL